MSTKEPPTGNENNSEINAIKQFTLSIGFSHITIEVLDMLSKLIYKSSNDFNLIMEQAYEELAASGKKRDALRAQLGYYIKKNYDRVRLNIKEKYNYDVGEYYYGVKSFIEQLAIVYCVFVQK